MHIEVVLSLRLLPAEKERSGGGFEPGTPPPAILAAGGVGWGGGNP